MPLLLCFNRPLADKFVAQAPEGVTVNTYHGFCKEMAEAAGIEIDFKKADEPGFWRRVQEQLVEADLSSAPKYDCLVVDEGQDFKPEWYEILQLFLEEVIIKALVYHHRHLLATQANQLAGVVLCPQRLVISEVQSKCLLSPGHGTG